MNYETILKGEMRKKTSKGSYFRGLNYEILAFSTDPNNSSNDIKTAKIDVIEILTKKSYVSMALSRPNSQVQLGITHQIFPKEEVICI